MGDVVPILKSNKQPLSDGKVCSACGFEKPATVEYFAANKAGKLGLHSQCRECMNMRRREQRRVFREDSPEEARACGRKDSEAWRRRRGMRTQEEHKETALTATERVCTKCSKAKSVEKFQKNSALKTHTQRSSWCRTCTNKYRKVWAKKNLREIAWTKRLLVYTKRRSAKWPADDFDLTEDFLLDMYREQMGLCFWSGLPLNTEIGSGLRMISVDRLDCSRGYTRNNIRLVAKAMNTARGDATVEEFQIFLDLLVGAEEI